MVYFLNMEPKVEMKLTCCHCNWETTVDLTNVGFGMSADPCEEHGFHTVITMMMDCSQCGETNELEIVK